MSIFDNPFVRVKDTVTGHEYSVRTSAVDAERHEVLANRPAVDESGDPLAAKPNVRIADSKNHREATRPAATSHNPSTASEPNTKE